MGGFTILAEIGGGGFGTVYRARGRGGNEVALKVARTAASRLSAQELAWQENEIEALLQLDHPSLVKILGHGLTDEGCIFIAMELVTGERLDHYLARHGRIEQLEAISIVRTIAEALAYCHGRDILHLDLKPQNIVLTDPHVPRLKVLDFGMAHLRGAMGSLGAAPAGTLAYMAPEQLETGGLRSPGPTLDLYALGTLFYELLSGQLPFDALTPMELVHAKMATVAVPIEEVCPEVTAPVAELLRALLMTDPARRPGSAAVVAERLRGLFFSVLRGAERDEPPRSMGPQLTQREVPFVGRLVETWELMREVNAAAEGPGRAVVVVGEPGIGKSRLVSETVQRVAAARELVVLSGRCRELGEVLPYAPLREAIGQLGSGLDHLDPARKAEIQTGMFEVLESEEAVLGSLSAGLYEGPLSAARPAVTGDDDPVLWPVGPEQVAGAISRLLAVIGAVVPVALILEDLHWVDDGTRDVLARLVDTGLPHGAIFMGTRRPGGLPARPGERVLALEPLPPADNEAMLVEMTGGADGELLASLKQSIPLLLSGKPLFNAQVLQNLEIEGYVRRVGGTLQRGRRGLAGYEPPDSVSRVLQRTLGLLPPGVLRVLRAAALLGRQFRAEDLSELGLFGAGEVESALAEAEAHWLCRPEAEKWLFVHDVIRESLEASVPVAELPEIHRRIATLLRRRGAPPGALARHLEHAGETMAAVDAHAAAARAAEREHDPVGATRSLRQALLLLLGLHERGTGDTRRLALLAYELVRLSSVLGDTSETMALLDRCAAAIPAGTPEETAAIESAYARLYYIQGNGPKANEYSERCLAAHAADPGLQLYSCLPANIIGRTLCITGRFGRAAPLLTRGCALAEAAAEYAELSHSEGLLGLALGFTGDLAGGWERSDHSVDVARRIGDPLRLLGAYVYRGGLSEAACAWDEGVQVTTRLLAFTEKHHIGGVYLYVGTSLAGRHQFHLGNLDRARTLLRNAINLSRVFNAIPVLSWTHAFLGDTLFVQHRLDDAQEHYEKGLAVAALTRGDDLAEPMCLMGLAHTLARRGGDPAEIRRLAGDALARLEAAGNVATQVPALQRHAEALEAVGEGAPAAGLWQRRSELIARLGIAEPDFWPRIPASAGAGRGKAVPPGPRAYWMDPAWMESGRSRVRSEGADTAVGADGDGETTARHDSGSAPTQEVSLFESLASVEGYLPELG